MATCMHSWDARVNLVLRYGLLLGLLISPTQASINVAGYNLSPVDPLIWGLFLLWSVWLIAGRRSLRFKPPLATALFFVFAVALSIMRAGHKVDALKELVQVSEYFLVAGILFLNVFDAPRSTRWALGIHGFAAVAVVALACAQYLHPEVAAFSVRGTFGNRNILGGYLALTLPLLFAIVLFGGVDRRWGAALIAVVTAGFLVNLSGATFLALIIALPFVALCRSRGAAVITLAGLLLLFLLAVPRMPRPNLEILQQSISVFEADGGLSARYTEWLGALTMWNEQPLIIGGMEWLQVDDAWGAGINPLGWLIGVGAGNFQHDIGMYYGYLPQVNINITEPDSHNTYLVILSTVGLLGLLGFAGMLLQSATVALRDDDGTAPLACAIRIGVAGALLAFAINAVWSGLMVRGIGIPLAFTLYLPLLARNLRPTKPESLPS